METSSEHSVDDILAALQTNAQSGLSDGDARSRLDQYGRNQLTAEKPLSKWRKFLAQFTNILVVLLLVAALVSAAFWFYQRESPFPYESMAIFAIVLLNAIMGYIQEARAEQALIALRQMSAAQATVVRNGARQRIPADELVPGDIILVEQGDTIPADARLIECTALQTAEAALTGESMPVSKNINCVARETGLGDRRNILFSGTAATYGHGRAAVTATGMQTEMGRIAHMLKETPQEKTPLQKELDTIGKLLGVIVVGIAISMIVTILLVEHVSGFSEFLDVLILGVALAVAAVPEGLPALVTAVLSIGVRRMASRNAIVRHLAAVETLGSATVIASDKTGTLTKNEMTVRVLLTASGRLTFTGVGYNPEGNVRHEGKTIEGPIRVELVRALTAAAHANNASLQECDGRWTIEGDPTEGALIVAARKAGLKSDALESRFARVGEVPFSSERKLMSTVHTDAEEPERLLVLTKGAPDILLARCSNELVGEQAVRLTEERCGDILAENEDLAGNALRTVGVAFRLLPNRFGRGEQFDESIEEDLVFAGLIGMIDPPRDEARGAVARAKRAGIRPIMITGDHRKTAGAIATELGITSDGRAVTGAELQKLSDWELDQLVQEVSVYARVNPEHKLQIVKALQRQGAVVAMTGDGVNDAPALKTADIGIAMGITGTDVSKEAADIVLTDDNFASIVAAVEEGRAIFSNIRKFLRYLLSSNIGEVMTMFFGVLLIERIGFTGTSDGLVLPLLATQILWINLVTDGAPALALGVDPTNAAVMDQPPRPRGEGVVTRRMWADIVLIGAVIAAGTLLVLDASLPGGFVEGSGTIRYAQSMTFTTLMLFQLFNAFNARSDKRSTFDGIFRNRWLWLGCGLSLLLHCAVLYLPFLQAAFSTVGLSASDWLLCTGTASSVLVVSELRKFVTRARAKSNRPKPQPV